MCPISPVQYPMFQPAMREIIGITNTEPTIIATSFDHQYYTGLIVRLDIPKEYGMDQLNGWIGLIKVLTPTQFAIDIDATFYTPYIAAGASQSPQVVPVGQDSLLLFQATRNVLPY